MSKISLSYYQQKDVVALAKDLIGKKLCTSFNDQLTSGIITETEAYRGWGDRACHANEYKRTKRTEIFYRNGGLAYVYLCYGIHHLFNIITNTEEEPEAILIRAVEPVDGIEIMLDRRNKTKVTKALTAGPGSMSQALGIKTSHYGEELIGDTIWLEEALNPPEEEIVTTTRVGVDYAGEDALHPWRFYLKSSEFVSKP